MTQYHVLRVGHQLGPRNRYRTVVITDTTCTRSGNQTTRQQAVHNGVASNGHTVPLCHGSNNKFSSEEENQLPLQFFVQEASFILASVLNLETKQ